MGSLRLWVGNIPHNAHPDALKAFLESWGVPVTKIFMQLDSARKTNPGYAFVDVSDQNAYDWALHELSGHNFQGRGVKIDVAIDKQAHHPNQPYPGSVRPLSRLRAHYQNHHITNYGERQPPVGQRNNGAGSEVYSDARRSASASPYTHPHAHMPIKNQPPSFSSEFHTNGHFQDPTGNTIAGLSLPNVFPPRNSHPINANGKNMSTGITRSPAPSRLYNSQSAALRMISSNSPSPSPHTGPKGTDASGLLGPEILSPAPRTPSKTDAEKSYWNDPQQQRRLYVGGLPFFSHESNVHTLIHRIFTKYNVHAISALMISSKIKYDKRASNFCVFVDLQDESQRDAAKVALDGLWMGWGYLRMNSVKARQCPQQDEPASKGKSSG